MTQAQAVIETIDKLVPSGASHEGISVRRYGIAKVLLEEAEH